MCSYFLFLRLRRCDEDIDECLSQPCQNNGTCDDLIGHYSCNCPEDFIGVNCEKPRIVTCNDDPCVRGNCSDVYDPVTDLANNYTCDCPFRYEGINCETPIDYCLRLEPCRHGASCDTQQNKPVCYFLYVNYVSIFHNGFYSNCYRATYAYVPVDIRETTVKSILMNVKNNRARTEDVVLMD